MTDMSPTVPPIYWWDAPNGSPIVMDTKGTKFFPFFSSEEKARAFRDGQGMDQDLRLASSESTAQIIGVVEALYDNTRCDTFFMSPSPEPAAWSEARTADQMIQLIEYTARR